MTNDDIKKAAIELCTTETQEEWLRDYGIHCFLDGARWRIDIRLARYEHYAKLQMSTNTNGA